MIDVPMASQQLIPSDQYVILLSLNNQLNNHQWLAGIRSLCFLSCKISFQWNLVREGVNWAQIFVWPEALGDNFFYPRQHNIGLPCLVCWQSLGVCIKSNLNSHAAADRGGQVEEIDAKMNKTWAKERKVTDQLETFKNRKENAQQHEQDSKTSKTRESENAFSVSHCFAFFVCFDKKLIKLRFFNISQQSSNWVKNAKKTCFLCNCYQACSTAWAKFFVCDRFRRKYS